MCMTKSGRRAMEPTKLSDLPFWVQVIAGFGFFIGTATVAAFGWVKKNLTDPYKEGPASKDAVVLSAAIADSQSISNLANAIDRLCAHLKEDAIDDARRSARLDERVGDVVSELQHIKAILRDRTLV